MSSFSKNYQPRQLAAHAITMRVASELANLN
jgi:hypothetical protein